MQQYKVLCALFSICVIVFYSFALETPWQKRKKVTKQLIVTHNIQEQEKQLLEEIIEAYPEWVKIKPAYAKIMQDTDFSIYTPTYFKSLIQVREKFKKEGDTKNEENVKNQIILYITHVAIHKQWPTITDKLNHINNCFQQYTLPYLEETWERYKPTMIVSVMPSESEQPPYETGTVEEVSSEEEKEGEKVIKEQPLRTTKQEKITTSHRYEKNANIKLPTPKEPKKQPNIFSRAMNFVLNGISSIFKWIVSWFR